MKIIRRRNCIICFENIASKDMKRLKCKHRFHSHCIESWFEEEKVKPNYMGKTCPICRRNIKPKKVPKKHRYPMYNYYIN